MARGRKYDTVILDRPKLMDAINAYSRRNGMTMTSVAKRCGLSYKFESNGKITFRRKHSESTQDCIEVTKETYEQICRAYLLTPERYIVTELLPEQEEAEPKPSGTTQTAYLRMLNERLMEIEKAQQEQNEILKRLLAVWEKA